MVPDFLVDVGNTSCKVLTIRPGDRAVAPLGEMVRCGHEEVPEALRVPGVVVVLAGSNNPVLDLWKSKIISGGAFARILARDDIPIQREMIDPSTVGVDRLLVCLGAQALKGPGPHLVVDAGTALTANLLCGRGHFLGGAIGPGMGVMSLALARKASSLFEADWEKSPATFPASTTREAIVLGIHMAAKGFVREAWDYAREKFPDCGLFLTGRDSPLIHSGFSQAELDLNLLFRGMLSTLSGDDNFNKFHQNNTFYGSAK